MRLTPVKGFTHEALKQWSAECLVSTAHVVSDGLWCFGAVTHTAAQHERHVVGNGKIAVNAPGFIGSTRYSATSRLRSAEHITHLITPGTHTAILQNFLIVSIAALIWLPWYHACCVLPLLRILLYR
ncbi:hypothetical protein SAMN05421690_106219 [Nitrosomonas sp. Nm51]|nr:hypothetical protein SAMN05421690_106219 [Nitrosomonas sp. Nm51]